MPVEWTTKNMPSGQQVRQEMVAALTDIGRYVRAKAAKYPEKGDSTTYRRTGTLGRSITVSEVQQAGRTATVYVGTNLHYAKHVEYGTGIYGRSGQRIRPKNGRALAWRSTGGAAGPASVLIAAGIARRKGKIGRAKARNVYLNFAASVRGMRGWHYMQRAFEDPATKQYFQRRVKQMFARLGAGQAGGKA